jgi:hypothetical protein
VFEDIPSSRYQNLITSMNFPNQVSTFAQMMEKNLNGKTLWLQFHLLKRLMNKGFNQISKGLGN